jgi:hypothetical protein
LKKLLKKQCKPDIWNSTHNEKCENPQDRFCCCCGWDQRDEPCVDDWCKSCKIKDNYECCIKGCKIDIDLTSIENQSDNELYCSDHYDQAIDFLNDDYSNKIEDFHTSLKRNLITKEPR